MALNIVILGAGIAGNAAAIALTKLLPAPPDILILEKRAEPGTIGGAVNLTPNAQRCLDFLGVLSIMRANGAGYEVGGVKLLDLYSGQLIGMFDMAGPDGTGFGTPAFKGLRALRTDLLAALLEGVSRYPNITIAYGSETIAIQETNTRVQLTLSNNTTISADLLLGCDGIHSAVRKLSVEPDRQEKYSGIAVAQGYAPVTPEQRDSLPFESTGLLYGREGSMIMSYFMPSKDTVYLAAAMEISTVPTAAQGGWRARGEDKNAVRNDIKSRLGYGPASTQTLIDTAGDWFLYPVNMLPPGGKWGNERGDIMLLGDAAHAMPPQGESTGIAIEDAILFARFLAHHVRVQDAKGSTSASASSVKHTLHEACTSYEQFRRPAIDAAYKEANLRWDSVKDSGWIVHQAIRFLTPVYLWWTSASRRSTFEEDMSTVDLKLS